MAKLIEIERCYGMEMNMKKTTVMRIPRLTASVLMVIDQKRLEIVGYCKSWVASYLVQFEYKSW
jgi:hypothetical protein